MELTPDQLVQLAEKIQTQQIQFRAQTSNSVGSIWDAVSGVSDADMVRFLTEVVPLVDTAQVQAIRQQFGFLQLMEMNSGIAPELEHIRKNIRPGTQLSEVYARPFYQARTALANGKSFAEAMKLGKTRAEVLAHTDISLAYRQAAVSYGENPKSRIRGWRRLPDANACRFCLLASTQRYHLKELMPLHNRCNCSVMPILSSTDPGRVVNPERLAQLKKEGSIPAVKQHGELGPVLVDKKHDFKTKDDLDAKRKEVEALRLEVEELKRKTEEQLALNKQVASAQRQVAYRERKLALTKQWEQNIAAARANGGIVEIDPKTLKPKEVA